MPLMVNLTVSGHKGMNMYTVPQIGSCLSGRKLGKVSINAPLAEVLTIMSEKQYSQMIISDGKDGPPNIVSWQSIAKHFSHVSPNSLTVSDCMEKAETIPEDASIVDASNIIADYDYVVVMEKNGTDVKGIVTASDFMESTKSFILIGAIEEKILQIIDHIGGKLTKRTFGGYLNFFKYLKSGVNAGLIADEFIEKLRVVRGIRNNVMHFDTDWNREENRQKLKDFSAYLEQILKNIEDNLQKRNLAFSIEKSACIS